MVTPSVLVDLNKSTGVERDRRRCQPSSNRRHGQAKGPACRPAGFRRTRRFWLERPPTSVTCKRAAGGRWAAVSRMRTLRQSFRSRSSPWTPSSWRPARRGTRPIPGSSFFVDVLTTDLAPDEIVTEIRIPLGSQFRYSRRISRICGPARGLCHCRGRGAARAPTRRCRGEGGSWRRRAGADFL